MTDDDPIREASTKVMTWASLVSVAAEALVQVVEQRSRLRRETSMWKATQERAAHQARYARDRIWWSPILDPKVLAESSTREAGLAWAASYSWRGDPEADLAREVALSRLWELRPDVMPLFDHLVASEGLDESVAMMRVAPLLDRPPAYPQPMVRAELTMATTVQECVQTAFPEPMSSRPLVDGERKTLLAVMSDAERWFRSHMRDSWVPKYLTDRGLESRLQDSPWMIGYAIGGRPGWYALTDHLRERGFSDDEMLAAGVAVKTSKGTVVDLFRDRLMVSVRDRDGQTVGFIGRAHKDNRNVRVPKYLNSPESSLYHKKDLLLGLWEHRHELRAGATPVIVEGAFDAMAVTLATDGKCVGVAPSGTAFTAGQADTLAAFCDLRKVSLTVALDGDAAGQRAARDSLTMLNGRDLDTPQAIRLPDKQDPAQLVEDGRAADLYVLLESAQPLADLVVSATVDAWGDKLQWVEGRVGAMRAAAPIIASLPTDDMGRQIWRVAQRLELPTQTVVNAVAEQGAREQTVDVVGREMGARRMFEKALSR